MDYQQLMQALTSAYARNDQAQMGLAPVQGQMERVNTFNRPVGHIGNVFEGVVDAFRRPRVQERYSNALTEALNSQRGLDGLLAQIQALQDQAALQEEREYEENKFWRVREADRADAATEHQRNRAAAAEDFKREHGGRMDIERFKADNKPQETLSQKDAFGIKDNLWEDFEPTWNEYVKAERNFAQMEEAYKRNINGAGDVAMLYGFVKGMDPESVVREGEVALANSANSVLEQLKLRLQKVDQNRALPDSMRDEIFNLIASLKDISAQSYRSVADNAFDRARREQFDPADVYGQGVVDAFTGAAQPAQQVNELERLAQEAIAAGADPEEVKRRMEKLSGG